jgi:zinc protease
LSGRASPKDIETMFQLIYLRFTAPRLDSNAFLAFKAGQENALANRDASPFTPLIDSIGLVMTSHHFRGRPMTAAVFAELDAQKALRIYRDRFSNAGDFTFVFVGAVNLDSLKPLVEKYIASLPATGRVEAGRDVGDGPPSGVIEVTVNKGSEPQAQTMYAFTGPFRYNPQSRFDMAALMQLSEMWLTDALREEMGGTYSPSISGGGSRLPRAQYTIQVAYQSSPEMVQKLSARLFRVIDSLKTHGPTEADVQKVKEQITRARETQIKTNAYWAGNILGRDENGEDIAGLLQPYDDMIKNLTAKQIQDAAKLYFDTKRYAKFVLLPEKKAQ